MSTLLELQQALPPLVAKLIEFAYGHGYKLTFGETYRTPEQAALNAKHGKGISHSLHTQRLAIDVLAFKEGNYLTKSEQYKELGDYWKTLHPAAAWGGDFHSLPDGNHFSLSYGGYK